MDTTVMLGHGSGGTMMKRIIDEVFFAAYAGEELLRGDDAAVLPAPAQGERLAFSTDSFVVTPHFFPGGDIGRLAVCGTVNDVATSGATPRYLSCGFVLEEGFPIEDLKRICTSMAEVAKEAGVHLVTGDTKVVNRGHGDGVYINTAGIGTLREGVNLGGAQCKPGDKVLVSGTLGDHGITIMSCRESLSFKADLQSDAAPLNHLIAEVLAAAPGTRCFRDPTRGGLASMCCRWQTRARWCASSLPRMPRRRLRLCARTSTAPMPLSSAKCPKRSPSAVRRSSCARLSVERASWICWWASSCRASARRLWAITVRPAPLFLGKRGFLRARLEHSAPKRLRHG